MNLTNNHVSMTYFYEDEVFLQVLTARVVLLTLAMFCGTATDRLGTGDDYHQGGRH